MKPAGLTHYCRILATLLLTATLFTGCGDKAGQKQAAASAPQAEQNQSGLKKLRVGYNPATGNLLCFIAEDKGIFKKEGLAVELVPFTATSDGLNALNAQKIDIGITFGTAAPLTFVNQGADFTFFGGYLSGGHPIYARPEVAKTMTGIQSYRGKKVASARLYTPDVVWRTAMQKAGIDIHKDLTLIEVKKPTEVLEAVKSGKADIGIGTGSTYAKAKASGLVIVGWSNDLWKDHACCRPVAKGEFIKNNQDTVVHFLRALIEAEKVYSSNPDYAVAMNQKYLKLDPKMAREFTMDTHQMIQSDPGKKDIKAMWDTMKDLKFVEHTEKVDIDQHINVVLYKKALDQLQQENPKDPYYQKLQQRFKEKNT